MTNKIAYISGTAKWARLVKPDDKFGGSWQLDLYPDAEGWGIFNSLNLELSVREDKDNPEQKYIKLRRATKKIIKGELVEFEAPKLIDKNAKPWDPEVLIGNGSRVLCKIVVYPTPKGNGHRLEAVQVLDLVEYQKTETVGPTAADFVAF